ncbi:ABC transporter substrate-binding protein [Corynebacterium hindlerae]|uniref:ABC transporter substrate-binding protein n=1 Tax=Corynebacterium hindlerae TaxID=699041 RepID=UPI0031B6A65C
MKKVLATCLVLALAGCSAPEESKGEIELVNCGETVTYKRPEKLWVNDGSLIATALAAGAGDKIAQVSSLARDRKVLTDKYGDRVNKLNEVNEKYPSLEELVAAAPDLYYAGWGYGLGEEKNVLPETLKEHGIDTYVLSESCRQADGKRGTMDPWEAVDTDLRNIAKLAGDPDEAERVIADIKQRREAMANNKSGKKVFVFDSGTDTIFTSGKFGGPQAIIDAAGGVNAAEDINDTWTTVSWEKLVTEQPDLIAFVDYPGQEYEEKVAVLKAHPAAKDLKAVKEERFVNLPYAMWTSGPLNIDAAEALHAELAKVAE